MRCILICLLACAPLSGCWNDCHPRAKSSLVLGTGELDYVALDSDNATYTLHRGPQGCCHVFIGLEATGLDATEIVTADISGTIDGEHDAFNDDAWLSFQCDEEAGRLQSWNTRLIWDLSMQVDYDGLPVSLHAEVTDSRGELVEADVDATLAYEPEQ